ncbi:MAG: hypothetical protein KR126chlam1_00176 [Chlamydiae bacterium]|nr:hypothetical protein [Chlamydiota bacterium]
MLIAFFLFLNSEKNQQDFSKTCINQKLDLIPEMEKDYLKYFFHYLLCFDSSAFVFFGDKPMSLSGYFDLEDCELSDQYIDPYSFINFSNSKLKKGWEMWKKHRRFFPSQKYLIVQVPHENQSYKFIILINKVNFLKVVNENIDDFQRILGEQITAKSVLKMFSNPKGYFQEILGNHHALLGLLLGYGKGNTWLFQRRMEIDPRFAVPKSCVIDIHSMKPSPGFQNLQEEIKWISQNSAFFSNVMNIDSTFNYLGLKFPEFLVNPNTKETHQLTEKYFQEYKRILHRFYEKDFLEITLQEFVGNSS